MRHVWLPSLGAWAQVQEHLIAESSCQSLESTDSARTASCSTCTETHLHSNHNNQHHDVHGSGSHGPNRCHHKSCKERKHRHHRLDVQHEASDEYDQHEHHHDWRDGSYLHDELHDQPHHTCPICLSPISQPNLTVLRWCMHRFCITCIEKWSCMQRFCPLCKQIFHGWYYNIASALVFDKKDLVVESSLQTSNQLCTRGRRERYPVSRQLTSLSVRRSKPLPWRRDFRFPRTTSAHFERMLESKADEAALQWRASVYKKNLRAVPSDVNSRVKIKQAPVNDPERKARIERRLEPWIHRELQAVMEDSNPSLLVQLVLSLWLHSLSEKEKIAENRNSEHQSDTVFHTGLWDSEAIRQLKPFLQEKASLFWHELRCFAESPFSLRTYDSVTKYEKCRD